MCAPENVRRNGGTQPGDVLILTKPIGVGIYSNAIKKGTATDADIAEMIASCTTLNRIGQDLAALPEVHALTDVTGFGVLGHGMEMARSANVGLRIDRISATAVGANSEAGLCTVSGCSDIAVAAGESIVYAVQATVTGEVGAQTCILVLVVGATQLGVAREFGSDFTRLRGLTRGGDT